LIECTIDNVEHILLHLDTAAPNTSLPADQLSALGLSSGFHDVWIGDRTSGVHIGSRYISSISAARRGPITGPGIPAGAILRGTAGTNLLDGYAVGIDFQGRSLWMIPSKDSNPLDTGAIPRPPGTKRPVTVSAELKNADPKEGGVLFVSASFDDHGKTGSFLVDTGANTNLALSAYWNGIHAGSTNNIPFDLADYKGAVISGAYRMGSGFSLDGREIANEAPAWVLDNFPVLAYEGRHFQQAIDGLIGLWGLYTSYTVLDYGRHSFASHLMPRIFLFPYQKAALIEENEFTGFSFTIHNADRIVKVVPGRDAEQRGVRDGDLLTDVLGGSYQVAATGVIMGSPGETRSFKFKHGDKIYTVTLTAEKLLRP
jgi:hypothetical protein